MLFGSKFVKSMASGDLIAYRGVWNAECVIPIGFGPLIGVRFYSFGFALFGFVQTMLPQFPSRACKVDHKRRIGTCGGLLEQGVVVAGQDQDLAVIQQCIGGWNQAIGQMRDMFFDVCFIRAVKPAPRELPDRGF